MIRLTKLNEVPFMLNCDMIETVQENPDTTIYLNNGNLYIVKESMQDVIDLSIAYKRRIVSDLIKGDITHGEKR